MIKQCRVWGRLLRLPNLFSIPGDILAGATLASVSPINLPLFYRLIPVSLMLYSAGLILNDYFDLKTDQTERPERPLPSGQIPPKSALIVALILMVTAFLTAWSIRNTSLLVLVVLLMVLIFSYNTFARKVAFAGFLVMGFCRGVNILLGASSGIASFSLPVLLGAGCETLYIMALSAIASNETKSSVVKLGWLTWTPFLALVPLIGLLVVFGGSIFAGLMILIMFGWVFYQLRSQAEIPRLVGGLIRGLIPLQACLITVSGPINLPKIYFILISLGCFLGARLVSRQFYGS